MYVCEVLEKIDGGCFGTVLAMRGYRNAFLQGQNRKIKKCLSFLPLRKAL